MAERLVLIEDDPAMRRAMERFLGRQGYDVVAIQSFFDVVPQIIALEPALVILDLGLPGDDGYTVLRELREQSRIPVLIVTARDSDSDELHSMSLGADDFVRKPYNTEILLLRIQAILRRTYPVDDVVWMTVGSLEFLPSELRLRRRDDPETEQVLSPNESRILHLLLRHKNEVMSRKDLMEHLWKSEAFVDDNTLSVNVTRLRQTLASFGEHDLIETVRGCGYRLRLTES